MEGRRGERDRGGMWEGGIAGGGMRFDQRRGFVGVWRRGGCG